MPDTYASIVNARAPEDLPYGGYWERQRALDNMFQQQREEQEQNRVLFQLEKQRQEQALQMGDQQRTSALQQRIRNFQTPKRWGFTERYENGMLMREPVFNAKFAPAGLADTTRRDQLGLQREQLAEERRQFDLSNELKRDTLERGLSSDWEVRSLGGGGLARVNPRTGFTETLRDPKLDQPKLQIKTLPNGGVIGVDPATGRSQLVRPPDEPQGLSDAEKIKLRGLVSVAGRLQSEDFLFGNQQQALDDTLRQIASFGSSPTNAPPPVQFTNAPSTGVSRPAMQRPQSGFIGSPGGTNLFNLDFGESFMGTPGGTNMYESPAASGTNSLSDDLFQDWAGGFKSATPTNSARRPRIVGVR